MTLARRPGCAIPHPSARPTSRQRRRLPLHPRGLPIAIPSAISSTPRRAPSTGRTARSPSRGRPGRPPRLALCGDEAGERTDGVYLRASLRRAVLGPALLHRLRAVGTADMAYYPFTEAILESRPIEVFNGGPPQPRLHLYRRRRRISRAPPRPPAGGRRGRAARRRSSTSATTPPRRLDRFIAAIETATGRSGGADRPADAARRRRGDLCGCRGPSGQGRLRAEDLDRGRHRPIRALVSDYVTVLSCRLFLGRGRRLVRDLEHRQDAQRKRPGDLDIDDQAGAAVVQVLDPDLRQDCRERPSSVSGPAAVVRAERGVPPARSRAPGSRPRCSSGVGEKVLPLAYCQTLTALSRASGQVFAGAPRRLLVGQASDGRSPLCRRLAKTARSVE